MADKSVGELISAQSVTPTDLFVLEQNGTAKKLTGQILENWLVSFADGHGGIQSIVKKSTSGLVDTYRITLADTTTFDFLVTNGKGVSSISKTSTSGLVDTYTIRYNDDTSGTFTVTNGAKGDKGDNANVWVKYASQKPTAESHSFGDVPDAWIGISSGHLTEAPTDWQQYTWYQWKGEKGDTGEPATLVSSEITYQAGDSGTIIPSGSWSSSVPPVTPGRYLWTREVTQWNTGNPITKYSVSRFGIDGTGAVSTVAGVAPDENGNVPLDAASVKALPIAGGTMEGPINMNGQKLSGLNAPTENSEAVPKGYLDSAIKDFATETDVIDAVKVAAPRNLLDNSYFANPVNQRDVTSFANEYGIDRWIAQGDATTVNAGSITVNGILDQRLEQKAVRNCIHTLAAMKADGTISLHCGNPLGSWVESNGLSLGWYEDGGVVIARLHAGEYIWAALYEGEYTIDTLPEYQPKGYATEYEECRRYFKLYGTNESKFSGVIDGGTAYVTINFDDIPMRVKPSYAGTCAFYANSSNFGGMTPKDITIESNSIRAVTLKCSVGTSEKSVAVFGVLDGYLALSADL